MDIVPKLSQCHSQAARRVDEGNGPLETTGGVPKPLSSPLCLRFNRQVFLNFDQ